MLAGRAESATVGRVLRVPGSSAPDCPGAITGSPAGQLPSSTHGSPPDTVPVIVPLKLISTSPAASPRHGSSAVPRPFRVIVIPVAVASTTIGPSTAQNTAPQMSPHSSISNSPCPFTSSSVRPCVRSQVYCGEVRVADRMQAPVEQSTRISAGNGPVAPPLNPCVVPVPVYSTNGGMGSVACAAAPPASIPAASAMTAAIRETVRRRTVLRSTS
jgi:hypothetical protein